MSARPPYPITECVGCGYCCETAACVLGVTFGSRGDPCDFLIFRDGRYWCRLVLEGVVSADQIYVGAGCCSSLNSKRSDFIKEQKNEHVD